MTRQTIATLFFLLFFGLIIYLFYLIISPFLAPIIWAGILATAFHPVYAGMVARLKGRRGLGSALMCLLISVLIVLPVVGVVIAIGRESIEAYNVISAKVESGEVEQAIRSAVPVLEQKLGRLFVMLNLDRVDFRGVFISALRRISSFFVQRSSEIVGGFAGFVASFFVMLFTLFFLFRDGDRLLVELNALSPLPPDFGRRVIGQFKEVTIATLYGNLLTAAVQGTLGGLIFLFIGLPAPLLWGAVMALLSLVPLVGTALVWLPVSIYLMITGELGRGVVLMLFGALVIGSVDNILKPLLIRGRARMHTLLVFFSVLGGLQAFGFLGFVLGPVIVAFLLTFVQAWKAQFVQDSR